MIEGQTPIALLDREVVRAHFMGIGGAGMAPLASIMADRGWRVSGCDLTASTSTDQLSVAGISVAIGHDRVHLNGHELLVISSAVPNDAAEVVAAREVGMAVVKRAWLVGALTRRTRAICVAGTAGKTTTTAMTAVALIAAGIDPSVLVGAAVRGVGVGGRAGKGDLLIVEADEYDRSFLSFQPRVAIVTNVEVDHLDCYDDLADIQRAFRTFLAAVPTDGSTIICVDDTGAREIAPQSAVTYGTSPDAAWRATRTRANDIGGSDFELNCPGGPSLEVSLSVPGRHNVLNATAALAVCGALGVDLTVARRALRGCGGADRRFELKGEVHGIAVYDDYAHHPTKVRAALAGARQRARRQIWCLFQPHTFNRTATLWDDFTTAFGDADHVVLLDIYSPVGRERPLAGVTAERLASSLAHQDARYAASPDAAIELIARDARPGDLVLTMGAGDVTRLGPLLLERLDARVEAA